MITGQRKKQSTTIVGYLLHAIGHRLRELGKVRLNAGATATPARR